jgi:hypothetical protein
MAKPGTNTGKSWKRFLWRIRMREGVVEELAG